MWVLIILTWGGGVAMHDFASEANCLAAREVVMQTRPKLVAAICVQK